MKDHTASRVVVCGLFAGLAAGAVVALWFLVVDLVAGRAFETPARLGSLWLGEGLDGSWPRLVVTYTALHFGAFAAIGSGVSWALHVTGLRPGLLIGAVVGVGVVNAVYYGGRIVHGTDLLSALPWAHVFGANLLGGMVMMGYLHRALRLDHPIGIAVLVRYPLVVKGLQAGVLGAAAVAAWFLVVDLMTNVPFYTPAALGSAVFLGATEPAAVRVGFGLVSAYTVLHVLAFWVVGTAFVWVAESVEQVPGWWLVAVLSFIVLEALFVGIAGLMSDWVLGAIGWVSVGFGNLLAVLVMGWWVWATHPVLQRRLAEPALDTKI